MIGIWVFLSLSRYTYIDKAGEDWRSKFQMEEGHSAPTLHQVPADNWISFISRTSSNSDLHLIKIVNTGLVRSTHLILAGQGGDQELLCRRRNSRFVNGWLSMCGCCCCIFTHLCPHHNLSYMLRHLPYCTMCFGWKYSPLVDCQGLGSPKRNPKVLAETVEDHYNLPMIRFAW